jgi:hypothetical protein
VYVFFPLPFLPSLCLNHLLTNNLYAALRRLPNRRPPPIRPLLRHRRMFPLAGLHPLPTDDGKPPTSPPLNRHNSPATKYHNRILRILPPSKLANLVHPPLPDAPTLIHDHPLPHPLDFLSRTALPLLPIGSQHPRKNTIQSLPLQRRKRLSDALRPFFPLGGGRRWTLRAVARRYI